MDLQPIEKTYVDECVLTHAERLFTTPLTNISDGYLLPSGLQYAYVSESFSHWHEMYLHGFVSNLKKMGVNSDKKLASLLNSIPKNYVVFGADSWRESKNEAMYECSIGILFYEALALNSVGFLEIEKVFETHEMMRVFYDEWVEGSDRESEFASRRARNNAMKRHIETYAIKSRVFAWLDTNGGNYRSIDKTAEVVVRNEPISFRTAQKYVSEWKKLRSPSKA